MMFQKLTVQGVQYFTGKSDLSPMTVRGIWPSIDERDLIDSRYEPMWGTLIGRTTCLMYYGVVINLFLYYK